MMTLRTLQPFRVAICSTSATPVTISSSQRWPRAIGATSLRTQLAAGRRAAAVGGFIRSRLG